MCLSSDFKPQSTENTPFKAGSDASVAAKVGICRVGHNETDREYDNATELLSYQLATGELLKDVVTQIEVTSRTL